MVGLVGRDLHLGRVGALRRVERPVRLLEVELREERLVRLQVGPAVGVERLFRRGEVPVGLGGAPEAEALGKVPEVRREIAGVAEPVGQQRGRPAGSR